MRSEPGGRPFAPLRSSLALGLVLGLALPAGFAGLLASPWSPWALEQAGATARDGDLDGALSAYERVARWGLGDQVRAAALLQGGSLAMVEGEQERGAVMLRSLLSAYPRHAQRDDALALLAGLEGMEPAEAAALLDEAVDWDAEDARRGDRMLRAARLHEQAGETRAAWDGYDALARALPERAPEAWLSQARLRLAAGDLSGANERYQRVIFSGVEGELLELAKLGSAFCLEDMGQYDAALAELDDLEGQMAERRRGRIARKEARR